MKSAVERYTPRGGLRLLDRALIGAGLFLASLLIGVQIARAVEVIPSLGITRAVNGDDDTAKLSGGLALRGDMAPFLMAEIGASFRNEERFGGDLHIKQWPITTSLWLKPVPMLYAGGGAGWYQTTLDYDESLPFTDETKQKFGVHLGGGLRMPLAPMLGLDVNGRYVFLDDVDQKLSTEKLDPDFWTTSVGLAIKF
jgi:hypothetical protein